MHVEMEPVLGRAPRHRCGQGRGPAFEVRARAEDRVRVDDGPGVAPCDVLTEVRLVERLVIDAGIARDHIHMLEVADQLLFLGRFARVLAQRVRMRKVEAARIRGRRDRAAGFFLRETSQVREAAIAHDFDIAHHVHVGHGDETPGAPELADLDLLLDRALYFLAHLPARHRLLLCRKLHISPLAIASSRPALRIFARLPRIFRSPT